MNKRKLFGFGVSAIGINMLNLIVGTYLCDALLTAGFDKNIENWTLLNRDLVVAGVWAVIITVSKVIDGIADVPLANFLDRLRSKIGRRKAGILIGLVPMMAAFIMFLCPVFPDNAALGTVWFGFALILFYISYTCTMLTYYAAFADIAKSDQERQFLSNVKSVTDVIYFILGFALLPILVGMMNIRWVAMLFMPMVAMIIIAFYALKGESREPVSEQQPGILKSLAATCSDKQYLGWLIVITVMTFGIQMFLTGQNVYLSSMGYGAGEISLLNACAFAPVPVTIMLYNLVVKKHGLRVGYNYAMAVFIVGLGIIMVPGMVFAAIGSVVCSFGIGTFFSVTYMATSHAGAGTAQPSMYFAVEGLFAAVATGISTGLIWVNMKTAGFTTFMPAMVAIFLAISCVATLFINKDAATIGKLEVKAADPVEEKAE
jgi:Na+/melibiose symporter-like transporter